MENTGKRWGDEEKYYSKNQSSQKKELSDLEKKLETILKQFDPELLDRVSRSVKQWNQIVRDYLRSETALKLSIGTESQSVPIRVIDGLPLPFAGIVDDLSDNIWFLLNRPLVEKTYQGIELIEKNYKKLSRWEKLPPLEATANEVTNVRKLITSLKEMLVEHELVKRFKKINQDILGAYFFRQPRIELYWMVIGIMAATLGVTAESLTVVVMAHELAHAYTHLGCDIDGKKWETNAFASSEIAIVEGLAQFYTESICQKLLLRMPTAYEAYEKLLKVQSGPYLVHKEWLKDTGNDKGPKGEIVRVSMIQCRTLGIESNDDFLEIINQHKANLSNKPTQN